MKRFAWFMVFAVAAVVIWGVSLPAAVAQSAANSVTVTQNAAGVGRYDIYELTMENGTHYDNPWEDPAITVDFISPSGSKYTVGGFLYDQKDKTNIWKVRFAPREVGAWSWTLSFANTTDKSPPFVTSGKFTSVASANTGFLRIHPCNNGRFMTEATGQVFYPRGGCYTFGTDDPLDQVNLCTDDGLWQPTSVDDYFLAIKSSGQNMVSWFDLNYAFAFFSKKSIFGFHSASEAGQYFNINGSGKNRYDLGVGQFWDSYVEAIHRFDFKLMMPFCASPKDACFLDFKDVPRDPVITRAWLNYHQYIINRYGAYVDIWRPYGAIRGKPEASYLDTVISYVRAHDPYHHLIGVSNFPDNYAGMDVNVGPGWCSQSERVDTSKMTAKNFAKGRPNVSTGLTPPLIFSMWAPFQFFAVSFTTVCPRLELWTCFFNQGACMFREQGGRHDWETRTGDKIFTDYIAGFDPAAKPAALTLTPSGQLAGSALSSPQDLGLYILHATSQHAWVKGATVEVNVPANDMKGQWLDPASGVSLDKPLTLQAGLQKISIPAFKNDIALRLRAGLPAKMVQFDNSTYRVNSDQSGVTLTVTRQGDPSGAVSVNFATRDSMAKAGKDYAATKGTLSWAAGDAKAKTITVPLIPTGILRQDLDFLVDLSNPTGGAGLGLSHSALVNILNVVVNTVESLQQTYVVQNGAGKIDFTLKRIGKGVGPLTMNYCTGWGGLKTGAAVAGVDYVGIPPDDKHTVVWADGDKTPKTISLTILSNSAATSGDREFALQLGGNFFYCGDHPSYSHGAPGREHMHAGSTPPELARSLIIIQSDSKTSPGLLKFKGTDGHARAVNEIYVPHYTVSANKEYAEIPISRTLGSHGEISVNYHTEYGTAAPGVNYTPVKGTLTWADGDTADKIIKIPLLNTPSEVDNVDIALGLEQPTGGAHWDVGWDGGCGWWTGIFVSVTVVYPPSR